MPLPEQEGSSSISSMRVKGSTEGSIWRKLHWSKVADARVCLQRQCSVKARAPSLSTASTDPPLGASSATSCVVLLPGAAQQSIASWGPSSSSLRNASASGGKHDALSCERMQRTCHQSKERGGETRWARRDAGCGETRAGGVQVSALGKSKECWNGAGICKARFQGSASKDAVFPGARLSHCARADAGAVRSAAAARGDLVHEGLPTSPQAQEAPVVGASAARRERSP